MYKRKCALCPNGLSHKSAVNYCSVCAKSNEHARKDNLARKAKRQREYMAQWKIKNPERVYELHRKHHYAKKYGAKMEDLDAMRAAQGNKCLVCDLSFEGLNTRQIAVDHCHKAGHVRGILCMYCNTGLGWYERVDPQRVAEYLKQKETKGNKWLNTQFF